ncbi:MAG: Asp23/Gls24 family envelope stress response protein [Coriobacteriia bacterium]|nr:Asp23/Gls24 family envelope stress response protein [Coriobacteriia bacterium]
MSDEIVLDGMKIAPSVLDTIVTMAVEGVEGVAFSSSGQGIGGLMNRAAGKAVEFVLNDAGEVSVCVHVTAVYGTPLMEIGKKVQAEVADAIRSQVGATVSSVDVFIDGIEFPA